MNIRRAAAGDVDAMIALAGHAATAALWSRDQYDQLFQASAPVHRHSLVLEETVEGERVVVAFIVARGSGAGWEIENLAVAGAARRRGLGARLLAEVLDLARAEQAGEIFLEVRESNHAARTLYEKWGFLLCGRRPDYYRLPQEDALTYRLVLSEQLPK